MRPLTIDLDELAFALNTNGEDLDHYLDLLSGKVLLMYSEVPDPEVADLLESEPERMLLIEPITSAISFTIMEDFIQTLTQQEIYLALEHALSGRKPFRTFKNVLMGYPDVLQAWYTFEANAIRQLALDWLEENDLYPANEPRDA